MSIDSKEKNVKSFNDFHNAKIISIKLFKNMNNTIISFLDINTKLQDTIDTSILAENIKSLKFGLEKNSRIINILERNQMKCSFFGRTSNGKSSIINAILGQNILPCGIGHTTNCFLQIQGTSEEQGFIQKYDANNSKQDNSNLEHHSIHSVLELGHALNSKKVSNKTLINLYWPYAKCEILRNDVSILDSPGIDIDPDVDYLISHNCLDADVFVLVVNSESTLTQTEKDFFHKVNIKVSKPNVFILNNRWDISDKEDNILETKEQHKKRCIDFLSSELNLCSRDVASKRIYFISAKEILEFRTNKSFNKELLPNFQDRYQDFITFETNLKKILCESALQTKFKSHITQGLELVDKIISIMTGINSQFSKTVRSSLESKLFQENLINKIKSNMVNSNVKINKYINEIFEGIRFKVEDNLKLEINHLNIIMKGFVIPFSPDPKQLVIYKLELNNFIEKEMNARLSALCSNIVKSEILKFKQILIDEYTNLLKSEIDNSLINQIERSNEHDVIIPYNSLFSDFKEDLTFQSSFSPYSLFNNILTLSSLSRTHASVNYLLQCQPGRRLEALKIALTHIHDMFFNKEFFGFCILTGLIYKITGSRIVFSSIYSYSLLYLFERVRWNMSTQEMIFKKQYVKYAIKQFANIIDISARSYSSVIKQELRMNHKSLVRYTDNEITSIENIIIKLNDDIVNMRNYMIATGQLRSDAEAIKIEFQNFKSNYLLDNV